MYKFYLKSNTAQEIVNIIFIAVLTLTSDSELVLNKRRASKWSVIWVWLLSCHESCLCLPEKGLEITDYLATAIGCPTYLARLTSVHIITV